MKSIRGAISTGLIVALSGLALIALVVLICAGDRKSTRLNSSH